MGSGDQTTDRTILLSPSQAEERVTSQPVDYFRCEVGSVLSSLTIRGMMRLFGTWVDEFDRYLEETPAFAPKKSLTIAGIGSWYMMIGQRHAIK